MPLKVTVPPGLRVSVSGRGELKPGTPPNVIVYVPGGTFVLVKVWPSPENVTGPVTVNVAPEILVLTVSEPVVSGILEAKAYILPPLDPTNTVPSEAIAGCVVILSSRELNQII